MGRAYPENWDQLRREIYSRDDYYCQNCGAGGGPNGNAELHAHHIVPIGSGGTHKKSNLSTLCSQCHDAIHGAELAPTAEEFDYKRDPNIDRATPESFDQVSHRDTESDSDDDLKENSSESNDPQSTFSGHIIVTLVVCSPVFIVSVLISSFFPTLAIVFRYFGVFLFGLLIALYEYPEFE